MVSYNSNNLLDVVQVMSLLSDVRNLQRDKRWEKQKQPNSRILPVNSCFSASLRLLKQQLQDCKLAIQSQHSSLEDRYSGMEAAMETLRKQNMCLQDMLEQVSSHCSTQLGSTSRPQQHRWRCQQVFVEDVSGCSGSQRHIYYLQLFDYWKALWKLSSRRGYVFTFPRLSTKLKLGNTTCHGVLPWRQKTLSCLHVRQRHAETARKTSGC